MKRYIKVAVRISEEDYDKMVQWFEMSDGITVPDFYEKCPHVQVFGYWAAKGVDKNPQGIRANQPSHDFKREEEEVL